ncbi:AarF/UbiB family protein [Thalassobacillus hwangdonensis]
MRHMEELIQEVVIERDTVIGYPAAFRYVAAGRSAAVFFDHVEQKAVKVYFPSYEHLAEQEAAIYEQLSNPIYFPQIYEVGDNYLVMEYIEGKTLYDCLVEGVTITPDMIRRVDDILEYAVSKGLNPSDTHLKNIILTKDGTIKVIDVVRFTQKEVCEQWPDIKKAYYLYYQKRFFPKKYPRTLIELIIYLYRSNLLPI